MDCSSLGTQVPKKKSHTKQKPLLLIYKPCGGRLFSFPKHNIQLFCLVPIPSELKLTVDTYLNEQQLRSAAKYLTLGKVPLDPGVLEWPTVRPKHLPLPAVGQDTTDKRIIGHALCTLQHLVNLLKGACHFISRDVSKDCDVISEEKPCLGEILLITIGPCSNFMLLSLKGFVVDDECNAVLFCFHGVEASMRVWLTGALFRSDLCDLVIFIVKPQLGSVLSTLLCPPLFSLVLSTSKEVEVILNG